MRAKADARELALLGALLLFVAGLCLQPMAESDLFFRLKVGQEILARHALLDRNLFSFTAPQHRDLDLAWGFEVAAAQLYRWGGFPAVVIGKTAVVVAVFAGAFAVCRRRGAGAIPAVMALAVAAFVMRERMVERPHVVSFLGEVLVLAAIARLDRPWSWRARLAFVVALVLWGNMHAGLFVGVAMFGLAGIGALVKRRADVARRAFVCAAVAAVAACTTPVGPVGIVRYLALHLTLPRLHTIDEFRHATWRSDGGVLGWLVAAGALVTASVVIARRSKRPIGALIDVFPAVGVAVLGLLSVRFSADAALVAAPAAAVALSLLAETYLRSSNERPRTATAAATVAALLFATVAPRVDEARTGRPVFDVSVDQSTLPLEAIRFVDDNGLRERMYNDFELGSYLLFEGYPRHRVFIDPRLPAYPEDLHAELGRFDHDYRSWDALMTRYGVESALLAYAGVNRRAAWWDPERWALVYRAGDARVFVRRLPRWQALIMAREIPVTFDFTVEHGATPRPLFRRPAASAVSACEWQRRLGDLIFDLDGGKPTKARPHYAAALSVPGCLATRDEAALAAWMGALQLGDRDWPSAVAYLDRALELAPGDTRTRANRAVALEGQGRRKAAAADWTRVAAEAAGTDVGAAAEARAKTLGR